MAGHPLYHKEQTSDLVSEHILKNVTVYLVQYAARIAYGPLIQLPVAQYLRIYSK